MPGNNNAPEVTGLDLLRATLDEDTSNVKALVCLLLAISCGRLTVNGQPPDEQYVIGEYLIHGGRLNFDLSALNDEEQNQFFDFITNGQNEKRAFATHRGGATDAYGRPAEMNMGPFEKKLGGIGDAVRALFGLSKHYGINLAIGGTTHRGPNNETPKEDGQWGHMYLHKDKNLLLVGIEGSASLKTNLRTNQKHSKNGTPGELSAFGELKIDDTKLHDKQKTAGKTPLSTTKKNNWATISVNSDELATMKAKELKEHKSLVDEYPREAQTAEVSRMKNMETWAQATKEGNKKSFAEQALGPALIVLGVVLFFTPIPIVGQVLGSVVVALGVSVAIGLVDASVIGAESYTNPSEAEVLYAAAKELDEKRIESNSTNVMFNNLMINEEGNLMAPSVVHHDDNVLINDSASTENSDNNQTQRVVGNGVHSYEDQSNDSTLRFSLPME